MTDQAHVCACICWRSSCTSARVDSSMPDTWQARRACTGGPRGSQEYRSILLLGWSCTCMRGPDSPMSTACQTPTGQEESDNSAPGSQDCMSILRDAAGECLPSHNIHTHEARLRPSRKVSHLGVDDHKECLSAQQLSSRQAQF